MAIQFLATELKHSGCLRPASVCSLIISRRFKHLSFAKPRAREIAWEPSWLCWFWNEKRIVPGLSGHRALRVSVRSALPKPSGVRRWTGRDSSRSLLRCRLGREYVEIIRRQIGVVDFPDLIFLALRVLHRNATPARSSIRAAGPLCSASKKAKSPTPTEAAIHSTFSPPCKDNWATLKCRGLRRATISAPR